METSLIGRTALITGGGTGIGAAIAQGMATEGANVVVNYSRSEKEATETVSDIRSRGGKAIAVRCDVSQSDQVQAMFQRAADEYGRVEILVNNAGQVPPKLSTAAMPEDVWDKTIAVNLKGSLPVLPDSD